MDKQTLLRGEEIKRVIALADGRQLTLARPLVMGILNVTPDSFSDGGRYAETQTAAERALTMVEEGADIIDIGGESTRPGADPVALDEEFRRVVPVIGEIRKRSDVPISVDTYKSAVAQAALDAGANIINDISALRFDPTLADMAASRNVPVILMHMLGSPRDMQVNPSYVDCVQEIREFFVERVAFAGEHGVDRSKVILDPGIGFGKRLSDNLEILTNLRQFESLSLPLLVGASRKSFIGMLHQSSQSAGERLGGSIAAAVTAVQNGANIVRVHDVAETVEALKVLQAVGRKD